MAKNHALLTGRHPVRDSLGALLLAVMALVMWGGCTAGSGSTPLRPPSSLGLRGRPVAESALTERTRAPVVPSSATAEPHEDTLASEGCDTPPPGWPAFSSSTADQLLGRDVEQLLAPFFSCTSPAAFVALQRRVDMARLVRTLDDWSAVRLGALGPVLPEAAGVLNHKRASFLVTATQEYGVAQAEVFALFVINTAFDKDVEKVLRLLSEDKRIGEATAERLRGQLGSDGLRELARYLRADPEAALLVAEGGEAGAAALYEARGNVPKAQAQDFEAPRVETYVGVRKPMTELRFADVLVIEQKPLPGQPPRVETFSFKSRDFSGLKAEAMEAQMKADAREALRKYGGTLDIRRPGLEGHIDVQRVRLVYEGGKLRPIDPREQQKAVNRTTAAVPGVEVLFR